MHVPLPHSSSLIPFKHCFVLSTLIKNSNLYEKKFLAWNKGPLPSRPDLPFWILYCSSCTWCSSLAELDCSPGSHWQCCANFLSLRHLQRLEGVFTSSFFSFTHIPKSYRSFKAVFLKPEKRRGNYDPRKYIF